MEPVLSILFNLLLHALLLGSMLFFGIALFRTAATADVPGERLRRFLAIFLGAIVVVGAQVAGVSFALFTADALSTARVPSAGAAVVAAAVPALAGLGLGYYLVRVYRKSEALGLRMLCFVGMLALVAFVEVYAVATKTNGVFLGISALPNLSFVAGVGLVFIFGDDKKGQPSLITRGLGRAVKLVSGRGAAAGASEQPVPPAPAASAKPHDPFDI